MMVLNVPEKDCRLCAHCFCEPDDDFTCGHSQAGIVGTYTKHTRKPDGICGPEGKLFEPHPWRRRKGDAA